MVFKYIEPISTHYLQFIPESLNINQSKFIEATLIRLLLGTLDMQQHVDTEVISIKLRRNLSNAQNLDNHFLSGKIIKDYLKPLTLQDLDLYLKTVSRNNSAFLNDLLLEFSYFFINTQKENHVSAFVHCYRILEYISYSFPLIHASNSNNFQGTFKSLQSYFTVEGGELAFFKNFIEKLFDEDPIITSTVDIEVEGPHSAIIRNTYVACKQILAKYIKAPDDTRYKFSIQYADLIEVIIHLRNRYFHFAIGGPRNIKTSDIQYPDIFFKQFNGIAINWISIIYFEILKESVSRWS